MMPDQDAVQSPSRFRFPARPSTTSLAFRLTAIAAIWAVLGLAAGGLALSRLFQQSVERTFDRRLEADLDALFAGMEQNADLDIIRVQPLSDLRYSNVFSGWYWQVTPLEMRRGRLVLAPVDPPAPPPETSSDTDEDRDGLITARSLWDSRLTMPPDLTAGEERRGTMVGPRGQELRYVIRVRTLSGGLQAPPSAIPRRGPLYAFLAAGDMAEVKADITAFNQTLWWSVFILAIGLIAAVVLQVRLGLRPLRRIGEALSAIREGKADTLKGEFPAEINPLARELNALLAHNQEVIARARTHVGNLAHFLKTPLSVLANEASAAKSPLAEAVLRQTDIMRRQVDHYLARARAAGSNLLVSARTQIEPVAADMARTLERIHESRGIEIEIVSEEGLIFRGERQDLEEMLGNLLDNACKWGRTTVRLTVKRGEQAGEITIEVGDDGPGLTADQRDRVVRRGERLDESKPGSGLGLSIVKEIAGLYGGRMQLGESTLGGLSVQLDLPGGERVA